MVWKGTLRPCLHAYTCLEGINEGLACIQVFAIVVIDNVKVSRRYCTSITPVCMTKLQSQQNVTRCLPRLRR